MSFITFAADLQTLSIHRKSNTRSARGSIVSAWTPSHVITNIDVQPVSSSSLRDFDGIKEDLVYECYTDDAGIDIKNGDRAIDPNSSDTSPNLEVSNLAVYPANALPGHCQFFLRKST